MTPGCTPLPPARGSHLEQADPLLLLHDGHDGVDLRDVEPPQQRVGQPGALVEDVPRRHEVVRPLQ